MWIQLQLQGVFSTRALHLQLNWVAVNSFGKSMKLCCKKYQVPTIFNKNYVGQSLKKITLRIHKNVSGVLSSQTTHNMFTSSFAVNNVIS